MAQHDVAQAISQATGLDITLDVEPGDILTDILIVARAVRFDNGHHGSTVILGTSNNTDGITQLGLARAATLITERDDLSPDA